MGYYIKCTREQMELVLYDEWKKGSFEKLINEGTVIEVAEPHGRLIGEDVLARKIVESNYGVDFINKATALIMDTPTVIEAEGE